MYIFIDVDNISLLDVHIPFMNVSISCTPRVIKVHSESLLMLDPDSYTLLASKGGRVVSKKFTGNSSEIGQVINISLYVMMFIDVWGKVLVLAYLILNMLLDIRLKIYISAQIQSLAFKLKMSLCYHAL